MNVAVIAHKPFTNSANTLRMKTTNLVFVMVALFSAISSNAMASNHSGSKAGPQCDISVPSFTKVVVATAQVSGPSTYYQGDSIDRRASVQCESMKSQLLDEKTKSEDLDCTWSSRKVPTTGWYSLAGGAVYATDYPEVADIILFKKTAMDFASVQKLKCEKITGCIASAKNSSEVMQTLIPLAQQYGCK